MNAHNKSTGIDKKVLISTIWIFVVLNYLYCDVVSLMDSEILKQLLAGTAGGMEISQGFLLGASILMEISISMVLLSRVLKYKANRLANLIAGIITTTVQIATLGLDQPTMYYLFFSVIEITSTALIVWLAWNWRSTESLEVQEHAVRETQAVEA